MARARPKDPPRASSSEEEGDESGSDEVHKNEDKPHAKQQENKDSSDDGESEEECEEGEEESSEEEEAETTPKISPQKKPQTRKALEPPPSDSAETDGSSESADDTEEASHFTVKRNASEKASPGKPAVVSKSPFKRAAKTVLEEPNKKQKTVMVGEGHEPDKTIFSSDKKRPAYTRVWSEADEIALLKGMIEFETKRGNDPMSDISNFYEVIKKSNSVQCDVSERQIIDKVKRLKRKYKFNVDRCTGSDEHPVFPTAHDSEIFDLSKKIWDSGANRAAGSKKSVDVPKNRNAMVTALPKHGGKNNTNTLVKENNGADTKPEEERGKSNTNTLVKENNGADPRREEKDVKMEEDVYEVDHCKKEASEMYPFIYETMQSMDGMKFLKVLDLRMIDKSKMEDLEQKFKKYKLAEVELACEKMKCMKDMLELIVTSGY